MVQKSQPEVYLDLGLLESDKISDLVLAPRCKEARGAAPARPAVLAQRAVAAVKNDPGEIISPAVPARPAVPALNAGRKNPNSIAPADRDAQYTMEMEMVLMPATSLIAVNGGVAASDSKRILMALNRAILNLIAELRQTGNLLFDHDASLALYHIHARERSHGMISSLCLPRTDINSDAVLRQQRGCAHLDRSIL